MINNYWRGVLMVFGTAMAWGAMSPIAKIISTSGLSQVSVMCYRGLFITVFVGGGLLLRRGWSAFCVPRNVFISYLLLGLFTLVCNATGFMMSCVYLSVPQALIIHYTFPLVTMAGSMFINREKPTAIQIIAAFVIIAGLYVGFDFIHGAGGGISTEGVLWGALSVFGLSAQTLLSRRISKSAKPDAVLQLFFSYFIGGIFLIVGKSVLVGWSDLAVMTPRLFAVIQYPALVGGLLGFWLLFAGIRLIPAPTASLICSLEIVFALILAPLLIHQTPTPYELAGCAMILAAVAASTFSGGKAAKK